MKEQCSLNSLDNLHIDRACLQYENDDRGQTIEIWGQSAECYTCSPWKFASVGKGESASIIINTTYATDLYFRLPRDEEDLHRTSYYFSQHGLYGMTFNSTSFSPIEIIKTGNDEYLLFLYAILFLGFVCGVRYFTKHVVGWFQTRHAGENVEPLVEEDAIQPASDTDRPVTETNTVSSPSCETAVRTTERRLHSLDTFRGLSIVLMIFVNYGGGKFYFFKHSPWNGLTVADLVFPWFLWIMGVCIALSIKSQLRKGTAKKLIIWKIFQRSIRLFWFGIILNSIHDNNVHTLRMMGVLQRISICYLVNGILEAVTMKLEEDVEERNIWYWKVRDLYRSWIAWVVIGLIAIVHILCTFLLNVPNCPSGYLGPGGLHEHGKYTNCTGGAARYIDQVILGERHMYSHPVSKTVYDNPGAFDPEGLFSTLMACLTVALGVAAGRIILCFRDNRQRILRWLLWSLILGLLGAILCGWSKETGVIPVNKNLWSLSFVFVTGSFSFILFSGIYVLVDVLKIWAGLPFSVAGLNSIFLYCGHEITAKMLPFSWQPLSNNHSSHLIMNISGACLWIAIAFWMHSRKLYFVI